MNRSALAYWEAIAERWRIAPPLAPSDEDITYYETKIGEFADSQRKTHVDALLLGVTPDIASMRWPQGTFLVAVDWSRGMFSRHWPTQGPALRAAAVRGDWRELPLSSASCDFAVGDGCYTVVGNLEEIARLNSELHRVLRPAGMLCLRCFCRPDKPESVERLFDELFAGRMQNLDLFRWLLAMAVHGASRDGVALRAVWSEWNERVLDFTALREQYDWPDDAVASRQSMNCASLLPHGSSWSSVVPRAMSGATDFRGCSCVRDVDASALGKKAFQSFGK